MNTVESMAKKIGVLRGQVEELQSLVLNQSDGLSPEDTSMLVIILGRMEGELDGFAKTFPLFPPTRRQVHLDNHPNQ